VGSARGGRPEVYVLYRSSGTANKLACDCFKKLGCPRQPVVARRGGRRGEENRSIKQEVGSDEGGLIHRDAARVFVTGISAGGSRDRDVDVHRPDGFTRGAVSSQASLRLRGAT